MPKRYEVLERSFINGRLYEPGETVVLEIDSPGSNLKLSGGKAEAGQGNIQQDAAFVAARGGSGKFVVKDAAGNVVGTFTGNKAEAEAEAARLNDGGVPAANTQQDAANGEGTTNGLPDA
jgi:hypothetical protein